MAQNTWDPAETYTMRRQSQQMKEVHKRNAQAFVNVRLLQAALAQRGLSEERMGAFIYNLPWIKNMDGKPAQSKAPPIFRLSRELPKTAKSEEDTEKILSLLKIIFSKVKGIETSSRPSGPIQVYFTGPGIYSSELMETILDEMRNYHPAPPESPIRPRRYGARPSP